MLHPLPVPCAVLLPVDPPYVAYFDGLFCPLCCYPARSCEPRTATVRGLLRLEAEQAWVTLAQQLQLQLTVFRLGGGWNQDPGCTATPGNQIPCQ